jgi:hypothetical protein
LIDEDQIAAGRIGGPRLMAQTVSG